MTGGFRVLVPLEDTPQAQRVLGYAEVLAAPPEGKLRLIRATDVEDDTSFNSIAENVERLRQLGYDVESAVLGGVDAVSAINSEVRTWHPDLVAMASTKWSRFDRWLNGSVTRDVVRSASVPVLVVPPSWEQPFGATGNFRILVPLDASSSAEQAAGLAIRLAYPVDAELVLLRAIDRQQAQEPVSAHLRQVADRIQALVGEGRVVSRVVVDSAENAILNTASEMHVDAIVMTTNPRMGGTTVAVFENATVPLFAVPSALAKSRSSRVKLGSHVQALEQERVGEVHRLVVDLEQRAVNAIVVLTRGGLARDILLPLDFVESLDDGEVQLRLTRPEIDALPDFAFNEMVTAPSTWTSFTPSVNGPELFPAQYRKRLGPTQFDITRETKLIARDGEIGHVESAELDLQSGTLDALWVRMQAPFGRELRIPADWVHHALSGENLGVEANRADVEALFG